MSREAGRWATAVSVAVVALLLLAPAAGAVVAGLAVATTRYPAVVRLADACTATLVAADRLLTAGHCVSFVAPGQTRIEIGSSGATYLATGVVRHPSFRYQLPDVPAEPYRDVALVRLDRPVPDVRPLPLDGDVAHAGLRAEIVGYGTGDPEHPENFGVLRRAGVIVRGVGACRRALEAALPRQGRQFRGREMLCTQDPDGRPPYASGCNGDSGGPLLRSTPSGAVVVAIDSWGVACGDLDGDPEVFSRMSRERAFVLAAAPAWTTERIREPWQPQAER